jgi:hypothetical protein
VIEFPELQAALVDAAGRRYARRRAWRPAARLILIGAAIAAVIALFVVVGRPTDVEQTVAPPKPRVTLGERFEVFRRAQTPADRLPAGGDTLGGLKTRPERTRRVARQGAYEAFLVPTRDGQVCLADYMHGRSEGAVCASAGALADETNPLGQFGPDWVVYALPDGVHDVRVVLADGTLVHPRMQSNAFALRVVQAPYSVSWVGASGDLHGIVLGRIAVGAPVCDSLDPLPRDADAKAANAAVLAARVLHPGAPKADVVSVKDARAPGCGRPVLSVELGTGERLWVGSAHSRIVVWPSRTSAG